jgi:hypothetical protein
MVCTGKEVHAMAYREVGMWEILNVLKRYARGESKTAIKQATGRRSRRRPGTG